MFTYYFSKGTQIQLSRSKRKIRKKMRKFNNYRDPKTRGKRANGHYRDLKASRVHVVATRKTPDCQTRCEQKITTNGAVRF